MITISLCMIVRNEEHTLHRCLESVREVADEIIIVDTGSTDRTREIAAGFTSLVYEFTWIDDFAAARNYSFAQATQEYIMWLDADDVIDELDRRKLLQLKETLDPAVNSVSMNYHLIYDEAGTPAFTLRRNRLVRRERQFRWIGAVHEYLDVHGPYLYADIAVRHRKEKAYTDRNLRIYQKRFEAGEPFTPRDVYYFANELRDHGRYERAIEQYERFWADGQGWVEDRIASCLKLAHCYAQIGEQEKRVQALLRSFLLSIPRPEVSCQLGAYFMERRQWEQAKYWYEQALAPANQQDGGGMVDMASRTWLPHLQLCVCFDKLGDYEQASLHNEKAAAYKPDHPSVLYNRSYFEKLHQQQLAERPGHNI
ncbi:Glycosyltransferase involved in cell wall bisynthesis [Paenibacillus sp. UNCCL117]|uniref:tetratricopeptide repeat-containing glycosyltransferase family 2 protein n=1 Tax=unclassified Paenibacillus TaxID=185978 RepID=UPI00088421F1|nr:MULTISPECIES: glycosyltransferase [unclassified Paenibacillus]SDE66225.1 Glycosyltransferase involved in cell wall bisynthesis [Paenibacillus sp. cl123]SFW70304.1 Glycosyltransferase involved in cell wall bisynthesis [Paenibacillus sp. UNCCL117]